MKFPGSKLLRRFDLSAQGSSLPELFRSSRASGFTGLVEVAQAGAIGLIFYYLGGEVHALYRRGATAWSGQPALDKLGAGSAEAGGTVSVFELPLDLAHLMRGLTKRQRLEPRETRAGVVEILRRLEKAEHTGTLEVQGAAGAAVVLLVAGRVSNCYFEGADGVSYEAGEARFKLAALGEGAAEVFLADFSRDAWKSRHEVVAPVLSRLHRPDPRAPEALSAEMGARRKVLEALVAEAPALRQALVFDLMTGAVYDRAGRGSGDLDVSSLAERLPGLVLHVRAQVEAVPDAPPLEYLELSTDRVTMLVALLTDIQEGVALLADRSQPTALLTAALNRAARAYGERLPPRRP